ncbi:MAG: hypothetical protein JWO25_35 [Alphaproteobacteria bacterium]|nr:hypothetical protein [Alphaproteobacteria bacterium]MDB5722466.1 hypothetical protein [Alphaproteobacteria bacterium]
MKLATAPAPRGAFAPHMRGYSFVYRENEINHCPGCGRTHWYIGRLSAECGFCQTAMPLSTATTPGIGCKRQASRG